MGRRHLGHVRPVHDEGELVVADGTPELLCHVVLTQRVLERDVDLEGLRKKNGQRLLKIPKCVLASIKFM